MNSSSSCRWWTCLTSEVLGNMLVRFITIKLSKLSWMGVWLLICLHVGCNWLATSTWGKPLLAQCASCGTDSSSPAKRRRTSAWENCHSGHFLISYCSVLSTEHRLSDSKKLKCKPHKKRIFNPKFWTGLPFDDCQPQTVFLEPIRVEKSLSKHTKG